MVKILQRAKLSRFANRASTVRLRCPRFLIAPTFPLQLRYAICGGGWIGLARSPTSTVDPELLLRNEYLATENRILKAQLKGRLLLTEAERATLGEIRSR